MEKITKIILLFSIFLGLIMVTSCQTKEDNLRLRIVAHSDSEIDQQNKILVKNHLQEILQECSYNDIDKIKQLLQARLGSEAISNIKIAIVDETFPAKSYQGTFIPSGTYRTLLVVIGEGKGKNFWTLLYPEFFNVSFEDDHEIEYRSYFYDLFNN